MSLNANLITDETVNSNLQSLFSIPEKDKGSLSRVVILSCSDGACFEPVFLWIKNRCLDYLVDVISKPGLVDKIIEDNSQIHEHLIQLCDLHSI